MDEEILNSVDAGQEQVVDAPTTDDQGTGAEAEHTHASTESTAEGQQEPAKPAQSAEENAQFAKIRREAEQKAAEAAQQRIDNFYKTTYAGQTNPYNGKPIDSEAAFKEWEQQEQIAQLAQQNGNSLQEKQALLQKAMYQSPEYRQAAEKAERLQAQVNQIQFDNDLAAVKKAYPKETAETIDDLGETFIKARAMDIDPITAYEIALAERKRTNPVPPSMGDINTSGADESEFYTIEQLKSMTAEDVHKNWAKVQKSRERLFKGV